MNPAYSVIFFTTASGAGYGLMVWLAAVGVSGAAPAGSPIALWGHAIAIALAAAGLLASTAHLGRPSRAWRAFSQWRTSWLSREGIVSLATFLPALAYAASWGLLHAPRGAASWAAFGAAVGALGTVWCTGMIYQSLPTIRAWNQALVTPIYLVNALATGGLLAMLLLRSSALPSDSPAVIVAVLLASGLVLKQRYWHEIDTAPRTHTAEAATGLGGFGTVRVLDQPHTQANFVMREMGYQVGRKHALRLRRVALLCAFIAPLLLTLTAIALGPSRIATLATLIAVVFAAVGVVVERWLFFAEAQHVVTLYYGAARA